MTVNGEGFLAEAFHPWVRWEGLGSGFESFVHLRVYPSSPPSRQHLEIWDFLPFQVDVENEVFERLGT